MSFSIDINGLGRGRGERQLGGGGEDVAGAVVGPGAQDQDGPLIERPSPGVAFAGGVALALAVLKAGAAQLAEGDRVAARLGEKVAAV